MRKQKMVRTSVYGTEKLDSMLDDGWLVELSNTCTGDHGETAYIEYIVAKYIDEQVDDDIDKYIL